MHSLSGIIFQLAFLPMLCLIVHLTQPFVYVDKITSDDYSNSCGITFDGVSGSFENMNLTTVGNVVYNVSCTGIEDVSQNGTIYVSNKLFWDWKEEIGRFETNLVLRSYILSANSFLTDFNLNTSYNKYSSSNGLTSITYSDADESIFYFNGILFNNQEKKEIVN